MSNPSATTSPSIPLWEQISGKLPPRHDDEWYEVSEIAPLLGLKERQVRDYCRQIWPGHEGHWRLTLTEAQRVIRLAARAGNNVRRMYAT